MYFISGIQDKSNPDQVSHIDLDHRNNFTLVEYPEQGAAMFKGIVYFPFVINLILFPPFPNNNPLEIQSYRCGTWIERKWAEIIYVGDAIRDQERRTCGLGNENIDK